MRGHTFDQQPQVAQNAGAKAGFCSCKTCTPAIHGGCDGGPAGVSRKAANNRVGGAIYQTMQKRHLLFLTVLLLLAQETAAATLSGRPSQIISGDKLVLTTADNQHIQIQLLGIQAPPLNTSLGRAARKRLSTLVAGKPVTVEFRIRNRWGHPLGKVLLGNSDINLRLLSIGLAMHQPNFQTVLDNNLYSQAMRRAKKLKLGIWALSK